MIKSQRQTVVKEAEMKDSIKNMDSKLEELRKASMNEINRLEALIESEESSKNARLQKLEDNL